MTILPIIKSAQGCQSCQLLQSQENPDRLAIIEFWDSVEAHQAAAQKISKEQMEQAMKLFASPPKGIYYHAIE